MEPIQTCYKCGKEKFYSEFYMSKRNVNGIEHRCIDCTKSHRIKLEAQNTAKYNSGIISKPVTHRVCATCGKDKLASEFNKQKSNRDGLQTSCRDCSRELSKKFDRNVRRGISDEEFDWLAKIQNGRCALCFRVPFERLNVDHDHACHPASTKRMCKDCIRGLLCGRCNRMFLAVAEEYPHLQTEHTKKYLEQRPFVNRRDDSVNAVIKPPIVVAPDSHCRIPEAIDPFGSELPIDCTTQ